MKKNKLYTNKKIGKIGNNQSSCEVKESDNKVIMNEKDIVYEKLKKLFNTNGYIFNIKVKIITNNKTYDTKIASLVGDNIITLDKDIIKIDDIKDIVF